MRLRVNLDSRRLMTALSRFPKQLVNNANLGLKIASRDIVSEAQQTHKYKTRSGILEKATKFEQDESKILSKIGFNTKLSPYALSIHDGSKPHLIPPKKKKALRYFRGGKIFFSKGVKHPGTKADKFLMRAVEKKTNNTRQIIYDAVEKASKGAFS